MVEKIFRRSEVKQLGGYGDANSSFDDDIKAGHHPPPDGYLGPKRPFWFEVNARTPSAISSTISDEEQDRAAPKANEIGSHCV